MKSRQIQSITNYFKTFKLVQSQLINYMDKHAVYLNLNKFIQRHPIILKQIQYFLQIPESSIKNIMNHLDVLLAQKNEKLYIILFQLHLLINTPKKTIKSTSSQKKQSTSQIQLKDWINFVYKATNLLKPKMAYNSLLFFHRIRSNENDQPQNLALTDPNVQIAQAQLSNILHQKNLINNQPDVNKSKKLIGKIQQYQDDCTKLLIMAKGLVNVLQFQTALKYLQKILQKQQSLKNSLNKAEFNKIASQTLKTIGICYFNLSLLSKSIQNLQLSLTYDPELVQSIYYLGLVYQQQNRSEQQLNLYKNCKTTNKTNRGKLSVILADYYYRDHDLINAYDIYRELISQNLCVSQSWNGLGKIYLYKGKYQKSKDAFIKSIKHHINQSQPFSFLACIYMNATKPIRQTIMQYISYAQQQKKNEVLMQFNLSIFYKLIGKYSDSSQHFLKCYQPLQIEHARFGKLGYNMNSYASHLIYKYNNLSQIQWKEQDNLFNFQRLLIFNLLNRKNDCKMIILKIAKTQNKQNEESWFQCYQKIYKTLLGQKLNDMFLRIVCENVLRNIFQISQRSAISFFQLCLKNNHIPLTFMKDEIRMYLSKQMSQINQICQIISQFQQKPLRSFDIIDAGNKIQQKLKLLKYAANNGIVSNITKMIQLYQCSISWSQDENEMNNNPLSLVIEMVRNQINNISLIHQSIIKEIPIHQQYYSQNQNAVQFFFHIKQEREFICDKIINGIQTYEKNKAIQAFVKSIKKAIEQFLTLKYLKNELIKFIWINNFILFNYLQNFEGVYILSVLQRFKKGIQYNLKRLTIQLSLAFVQLNVPVQQQIANQQIVLQTNTSHLQQSQKIMYRLFQQQSSNNSDFLHGGRLNQNISMKQLTLIDKKRLSNLFLFQNQYDLMNYLSKNSQKIQHIAQYLINQSQNQGFIVKNSFSYKIEKGEIINTIYSQIDALIGKFIEQKGKLSIQIIKIIIFLAKSIQELEKFKIICMNIQSGSFIKNGDGVYKIYNLNHALKYGITQDQPQNQLCYKNTQLLFRLLLSYNISNTHEEQNFQKLFGYVFRDCSQLVKGQITKAVRQENWVQKLLVSKLQLCVKKFHRDQFQRIMKFLVIQSYFAQKSKFTKLRMLTKNYIQQKIKTHVFVNSLQTLLK